MRFGQNKPTAWCGWCWTWTARRIIRRYLLSNPYRLVIDVHAKSDAAVRARRPLRASDEIRSRADNADRSGAVASELLRSATSRPPPGKRQRLISLLQRTCDSEIEAVKADQIAALKLAPAPLPKPNRDGQRSLTRALGLKISRIVIDPGHGGHDTGTIGPHGLMEKDLCLDVALRLGRLIEQKLPSAEVVYTRKDDTFVPLEERTAIANQAKADLFISIHANSSHDRRRARNRNLSI